MKDNTRAQQAKDREAVERYFATLNARRRRRDEAAWERIETNLATSAEAHREANARMEAEWAAKGYVPKPTWPSPPTLTEQQPQGKIDDALDTIIGFSILLAPVLLPVSMVVGGAAGLLKWLRK